MTGPIKPPGEPPKPRRRRRPPPKRRKGVQAQASAPEPGTAMVTSSTTTAPASAAQDPAADQADGDLAAFFSTGTGPAMHYDQTASGGIGQEQPSQAVSAP